MEDMLKKCDWMKALLQDRIQLLKENEDELERLKKAGRIYATTHWRSDKYLYLIHPMKNGERKREYIGANPEKTKEAIQKVKNARNYDGLKYETEKIRGALCLTQSLINRTISDLERMAPLDLVTKANQPGEILSPSTGDRSTFQEDLSVTNETMVTDHTPSQIQLSPMM